jgi:hypothetical protein
MITTFTGHYVNPLELRFSEIHIEDIAHALSLINRFVGHTKFPLSVAQHSVMAARMLEGTPHALQALLHDGSEAYLGDVSRWVKASPVMAHYRQVEEKLQATIFLKYGTPMQMHPAVVGVDNLLLLLEGEWLVNNWERHIKKLNKAGYGPCEEADKERWWKLGGGMEWGWQDAERAFLETFARLCPHTVGP